MQMLCVCVTDGPSGIYTRNSEMIYVILLLIGLFVLMGSCEST